jgi:Raf kinase inhibitor-like YbhB/YbcL family protein
MVLRLRSSSFEAGGMIPAQYTCRGSNISPELSWGEAPEGTQSFALIMDDPDARNGSFVHWVIFNIPATARGLPEGLPRQEKLPDGTTQGVMGRHEVGYYGPCPPSGLHRYFFKLYGVDSLLELGPDASAEDLIKAISGHIVANTELVGLFSQE